MGVHGTPWHKGQSTKLVIEIYVLRSAKVLVDTDHDKDGPYNTGPILGMWLPGRFGFQQWQNDKMAK